MSMPKGQYMLQRRQAPHSVKAMRAALRMNSPSTLPLRLTISQSVSLTLATGA